MSVHWVRIAGAASLRLLCLLGVFSIIASALMPVVCQADEHQGDRFAIRAGIWPQKGVSGSLGTTQITPGGLIYDARVDQRKTITPLLEFSGLFHLRRFWWAEGDIGWSTRPNVRVAGVPTEVGRHTIAIGQGRVDFFPLFVGIRAVRRLGSERTPHNVYARAGISIVFASESPSAPVLDTLGKDTPIVALDSLSKYNVYYPGTEAAFGFAAGFGGEVYYLGNIAAVADVQFRYVRFNYGPRAKFDVSGVWFSLGFGYKTR